MQTIIIDKFLVMNSKREVLVFVREGEELSDIFLPRKLHSAKEEIEFQRRICGLLEREVAKKENIVFLYEQPMYEERKDESYCGDEGPITKRYYACMSDFDEEFVGSINLICNECNVLPYLVRLETLKQKAWKNIRVPKHKRKVAIDIDLPKPIKILKYKLDYVEY